MKLKNKKLLIAFCGYKQVGKDTSADYFVNNYNYIKYSFAMPIKEGVKYLFGFSDKQVYDEKLKDTIDIRYNVTPRKILQVFGTDIFQFELPKFIPELKSRKRNHWVLLFKEWYEKNKNLNIVISDLRFPHEAQIIKDLGGYVIRIHRYGYNKGKHISESEVDDIIPDFEIYNNGNFRDLYYFINLLKIQIYKNKKDLSEFSFDMPTEDEIEEYLEFDDEDEGLNYY